MHPIALEFENVGPYKGKHSLVLGSDVYALVARHESNEHRSNWVGKTSLLWLFAYGLFGEHPKATDDEWITDGEKSSRLVMRLSDGTITSTEKKRGASTLFEVRFADGRVIQQAAGRAALAQHIGLEWTDFSLVCFFEQKKLSRLVSSRSADRIEAIESWLASDLAPLQTMHEEVSARRSKCAQEVIALERELAELNTRLDELSAKLEAKPALEAALSEAQAQDSRAQLVAKLAASVAKYEQTEEAGIQLSREIAELPASSDEAREQATQALESAVAEHTRKVDNHNLLSSQSCGAFDGLCPVAHKSCPAHEWVRSQGVSPQTVAAARQSVTDARARMSELKGELNTLAENERKRTRKESELTQLREKCAALIPDVDAYDSLTESELAIDARVTSAAVSAAHRELILVEQAEKEIANASHKLLAKPSAIAAKREQLALLGEAVQLLGRTGAQQRIAEQALNEIESEANAILARAGVRLAVSVKWQSIGQGLAKNCASCGTAFPKSAKAKECAVCSAVREQNVISKLDIALDHRSGAAEDLAGFALSLAASEWLRAKRGSKWSAVFIDEPFGALDAAHKQSLTASIQKILSAGFESAFVVAHDRHVMDSLPARLLITQMNDGSRVVTSE